MKFNMEIINPPMKLLIATTNTKPIIKTSIVKNIFSKQFLTYKLNIKKFLG